MYFLKKGGKKLVICTCLYSSVQLFTNENLHCTVIFIYASILLYCVFIIFEVKHFACSNLTLCLAVNNVYQYFNTAILHAYKSIWHFFFQKFLILNKLILFSHWTFFFFQKYQIMQKNVITLLFKTVFIETQKIILCFEQIINFSKLKKKKKKPVISNDITNDLDLWRVGLWYWIWQVSIVIVVKEINFHANGNICQYDF